MVTHKEEYARGGLTTQMRWEGPLYNNELSVGRLVLSSEESKELQGAGHRRMCLATQMKWE